MEYASSISISISGATPLPRLSLCASQPLDTPVQSAALCLYKHMRQQQQQQHYHHHHHHQKASNAAKHLRLLLPPVSFLLRLLLLRLLLLLLLLQPPLGSVSGSARWSTAI